MPDLGEKQSQAVGAGPEQTPALGTGMMPPTLASLLPLKSLVEKWCRWQWGRRGGEASLVSCSAGTVRLKMSPKSIC